ncbi:hypothetical protein ACF0H5_024187 [Mactra antiquata]
MRIDVLLFPNCCHGNLEETIVEGASFTCMDHFELLERWDVQLVKKRSPEKLEGFVSGRAHLQAVRSYLHFSQLSSWLISSGGSLPFTVVYRIYAPGEAVGYTFSRLPEVHNFPSAELANIVLRSTVAHLPRQEDFMTLKCRSTSPSVEQHLRCKKMVCYDTSFRSRPLTEEDPYYDSSPGPSTSKSFYGEQDREGSSVSQELSKCPKSENQQINSKPPIGRRKQDAVVKTRAAPCPVSKTPKRKVDQLSPTMKCSYRFPGTSGSHDCGSHDQNLKLDCVTSSHSIVCSDQEQKTKTSLYKCYNDLPNESMYTKETALFKTPEKCPPVKVHPYRKPSTLSVATNQSFAGSKRLPSPKVLVTGSKKPYPTEYKKRCLDLNSPESSVESVDDFSSLKPLDEMISSDLHDLIKPLSPSQLEAYLTSLSNKAPKKLGAAKLDDIPSTNCSFFLCDSNDIGKKKLSEKGVSNLVEKSSSPINDLSPTSSLSISIDTDMNIDDLKKVSENNIVRNLFSRSNSSPELETSFVLFDSDSSFKGKKETDSNKVNIDSDVTDLTSEICDKNSSVTVRGENHSNLSLSSLSREVTPDLLSENSRKTTLNVSCRNSKLQSVCIPCSVGGVNTAIQSLAQNLETMDIEADGNVSTLSSSVDSEVENHFKADITKNSEMSSDNCDITPTRDLSLCKQLLKRDFQQNVQNEILTHRSHAYKSLPSPDDVKNFHFVMGRSASAIFNTTTGLPSRSSPAPMKKNSSTRFDYDCTLTNVRAIKNAISCSKLTLQSEDCDTIEDPKVLSTSAPASTNCLLGNFEESVLNGRIEPVGVVEGFNVEIGAGGTFCPKHVTLPVIAYFFQLSDDNAPSPYLGYVNLEPLGKRGYHIPRTGTVQVTLFNPNKTVVKMFVVMYDLSDMPANCQTFLRQRTMYTPVDANSTEPSYLRYLIHLRFQSSKSGKIYLHTDIRLIFARDKFEFDPQVANYELRSFTEGPDNPKFSPKR